MNRKLILRVLGALLGIEAAAMFPSFLVSLIFQDGDSLVLGMCFLGLLIPGLFLWFAIKSGAGSSGSRSTHLPSASLPFSPVFMLAL